MSGAGRAMVYLSGSVEKVDDENGWRKEVQDEYGYYNWYNPVEELEYDTPLSPAEKDAMVMQQLRKVKLSDFLLVKYVEGQETWGTPTEVRCAFTNGVPIVVWTDEDEQDIPNYLFVFADFISDTLEKCLRVGGDLC